MAAPAAVLSILVRANTGAATTGLIRFNQHLDATEKHSHKAAKAIESVAKASLLIGGAAVVGGFAYATKKAADFEQQISSLGSVTDATAKQMDRFRKQALKAGADTKFSALEAAQAQTELAKGGLKTAQILKGGLKSALALAAAGEMDLAEAASTTANAMNLFSLRGKASMKVADMLAKAANATTADVSDFAMALSQGGSVAKSAGLSFRETVLALEALAKSGIKNSDAGTSLKTSLIQLLKPTAKQKELADKLNISFLDQAGNFKSLADVSTMLRNRLGDMTKAQRTAVLATLAGTDGVRTLTALYDAGAPRLNAWSKGLAKQGTAAEVAKRKQDNLKGSLEQLRGSFETLAIQVGTGMLPAIRKVADELTGLTNDIGRIMSRTDLTLGEKLQRSLDLAKVRIDPWVDKLKTAIDHANIPDKLAAVISAATPLIIKAAAQAGLATAKTFAGAFAQSDVWGKLVLGGWLLSRMGGKMGFFKMGAVAGTSFGEGMATTSAVGFAGKFRGLVGGLASLGKKLLILDVALNLVDQHGNPIAAAINTAHDLTFGIVPKVKNLSGTERAEASIKGIADQLDRALKGGNIAAIEKVRDRIKGMAAEARDFGRADLAGQLDRLASRGTGSLNRLSDAEHKVAGMSDRFAASIRGLRLKGSKDFDGLVQQVTFGSRQILKVGGEKSQQTQQAISHQFGLARKRVKQAMDDNVVTVKQGMNLLHALAVKELGLYGIKAGRVNVVLAAGPNGQMRPHARGGHINEGKSSGDSVPALLERGEYVLNRKAVSKVGKKSLDQLNFAAAPRFQKGGNVGIGRAVLTGPPSVKTEAGQGALDRVRDAANAVVKAASATAAGDTTGVSKGLAPQVLRALAWARAHGWTGSVTSGRRSSASQQYLWDNAARLGLVRGVSVAAPGTSMHERGLAVDVTDIAGFQRAMASAPPGARLIWRGPSDPVHFSTTGHQLGGLVGLQKGGSTLLSGLNKVFPASSLGSPGVALEPRQVRAVAEKWGHLNPARALQAMQISKGESAGYHPGIIGHDPGGTLGIGLWQITRGVQGALAKRWIDSRGGDKGMRNPKNNAEVMSLMSHKGASWSNWHGTAYLKPLQKGVKSVLGNPADRKRAMKFHARLKRIRAIGLPDAIQSKLTTYSHAADVAEDLAARAATLTGDSDTQALVRGKTQEQWLKEELTALFKYRNVLIRAEQIAVARREMLTKLIDKAYDQLRKLKKHPKSNRRAIAQLRDKVIPALQDKRRSMNTTRGDLLSSLTEVQGIGSSMALMKHTPAVGVLGGRIFDTQIALRDLAAPVTATDSDTEPSESDSLLAQLGREVLQRTAVENRQLAVLKDFPDMMSKFPQFATGGIVPGVTGQPVPAVVHAGEGVFTRDQMSAMGGGQSVVVIVQDGAVDKNKIRVIAGQEAQAALRSAGRGPQRALPGGGGGLGRHG